MKKQTESATKQGCAGRAAVGVDRAGDGAIAVGRGGMRTMTNVLLAAALSAGMMAWPARCRAAETAAPLPAFVENGQAAFRIEVGAEATDSELLAVAELSVYLARVTGLEQRPGLARFYDGGAPSPEGFDDRRERIIYVGHTAFAKAHGLDGAAMRPEEWAVKTVGTNLILTGGRPRGTLYAVYDFLEQACGVWWLDRDTEVVPKNPNLALPALERRGKPQAWFRNMSLNDQTPDRPSPYLQPGRAMNELEFLMRNRSTLRTSHFTSSYARGYTGPWLSRELYGAPYTSGLGTTLWDRTMALRDGGEPHHRACHTFFVYLPPEEFYQEHPEYYTFTRENAPSELPHPNYGHICLTHPDVRRIVPGRMMDLIRRDRAAARSFGTQPPRFYDLSQLDDNRSSLECGCAACRDFVKEHGEESDLLIDFVNTAAAEIEKTYPDVTITTMAYMYNMKPPRTVRPRGNVLVEWCNWGNAPDGGPFLDQALTHPDNAWRLENLRAWRDTVARLGVWDYMEWCDYPVPSGIPATFAPYAIGNLQVYNELGVEWVLDCDWQSPRTVWSFENFEPLRRWITLRLMSDPACDVPQMLEVFFRGYYGPAAKPMRAFYDLLVAKQAEPREKRTLIRGRVDYLTPAFYQAIQRLLDEAEAAAAADPGALLRVRRERPRVDLSMLDRWSELERQLPDDQSLPFDRAQVLERFAAYAKAVAEGLSLRGREYKVKAIEEAMADRRGPRPPGLPEPLAGLPTRDLLDVTSKHFKVSHLVWPWVNLIVDDSDAAVGRVMVFGLGGESFLAKKQKERDPGWTRKPIAFQLAGLKHTLTPEEFPRDGRYHLYKLGQTQLSGTVQNFEVFMNGRTAGGLDLATVASARDRAMKWDVYVSAKLAGPSFAGSADADCVRVERVLLVRATAK